MVLDSLAPARRRLVLVLVALAGALILVVGLVVALGRPAPVVPVSQDRLGPVLLVPGYGGSVGGLDDLAGALRSEGRTVQVVAPPGDGRGDLREHAALVAQAARGAVAHGAPSVDLVGYSAGGVVVRYVVAELGGGDLVRRVVTLASPHHGTEVAAEASGLGERACPTACQQLVPDSDLLSALDRGDQTPPGPQWVALWTTADDVVVPATSGRLEGAVSFALQDVCPGDQVEHSGVPSDPSVVAIVLAELGTADVARPPTSLCVSPTG